MMAESVKGEGARLEQMDGPKKDYVILKGVKIEGSCL